MADLSQFFDDGFDDRSVAPSTGIPEPVPPGEYLLQVEQMDVVPTKDSSGMILKAVLAVVNGEYEGRKIFPNINIRNKNMQAQTIGIGEFKAMCLAIGVDYEIARTDTDQLLWKPFRAMVGFEKEQINPTTGLPYAPKNRVTRYIPADAAAPVAAPAAPRPAPAPDAARPAPASARPAPAGASAGLPWKTGTR